MYKDFGKFTVHINRYHIYNWAFGIDYYQSFDFFKYKADCKVLMLNLLFFNITLTKWC